jgi:hypothetical protein
MSGRLDLNQVNTHPKSACPLGSEPPEQVGEAEGAPLLPARLSAEHMSSDSELASRY